MSLPESMRAGVYVSKGTLEIEERPLPETGPRDALVEVSHCGVCGTDLHFVMEGWGRPNSIGGHEYSGTVVAVGAEVDRVAVGDRVVAAGNRTCGRCEYCRGGRPSLCLHQDDLGVSDFQGAFAEFVSVEADRLLSIPNGLGEREAALCEPLAVALHGITRADVEPDQRVLVIGAGPIGALCVAVLRDRGAGDVVVCEPSEARRALALKLGASSVVTPDALATPPMPFTIVDEPFHVVFECSGKSSAVEQGIGQLRRAGRLVMLGTGMERARLDGNRMILNELEVVGALNYDLDGFDRALALLASGRLPTDHLIESADVGLDDLLTAMQGLTGGHIAGKVMVRPGRGAHRMRGDDEPSR